MMTTADIAKLLGVSERCVLARAKARGVLPWKRVGRSHVWFDGTDALLRPLESWTRTKGSRASISPTDKPRTR